MYTICVINVTWEKKKNTNVIDGARTAQTANVLTADRREEPLVIRCRRRRSATSREHDSDDIMVTGRFSSGR